MIEEQLFDAALHDRDDFSCGNPELDNFLKRFATQQSRKGITVVRVLIDSEVPQRILGYYTLSAAQVETASLDEKTRKQLPRYPVPCFRLGRLATDVRARGQGVGRLLIGCAVERCIAARKSVAGFALIVDAKDRQAADFYRHFGFIAFSDDPLKLYLPLG